MTKVKPLNWYAPDPQDIMDSEDCLLMAVGFGGRYAISRRELVRIASPDKMGHLLWDAKDPFSFTEHLTVEDAQAAAQTTHDNDMMAALAGSSNA